MSLTGEEVRESDRFSHRDEVGTSFIKLRPLFYRGSTNVLGGKTGGGVQVTFFTRRERVLGVSCRDLNDDDPKILL